jgi:hypothetical protein
MCMCRGMPVGGQQESGASSWVQPENELWPRERGLSRVVVVTSRDSPKGMRRADISQRQPQPSYHVWSCSPHAPPADGINVMRA